MGAELHNGAVVVTEEVATEESAELSRDAVLEWPGAELGSDEVEMAQCHEQAWREEVVGAETDNELRKDDQEVFEEPCASNGFKGRRDLGLLEGFEESEIEEAVRVFGPVTPGELEWAMQMQKALMGDKAAVEQVVPTGRNVFLRLGLHVLRVAKHSGWAAGKWSYKQLVEAVVRAMGAEITYISRGDCWANKEKEEWDFNYVLHMCKMVEGKLKEPVG